MAPEEFNPTIYKFVGGDQIEAFEMNAFTSHFHELCEFILANRNHKVLAMIVRKPEARSFRSIFEKDEYLEDLNHISGNGIGLFHFTSLRILESHNGKMGTIYAINSDPSSWETGSPQEAATQFTSDLVKDLDRQLPDRPFLFLLQPIKKGEQIDVLVGDFLYLSTESPNQIMTDITDYLRHANRLLQRPPLKSSTDYPNIFHVLNNNLASLSKEKSGDDWVRRNPLRINIFKFLKWFL